jgi:transglutaminase-like putative cysteine protease
MDGNPSPTTVYLRGAVLEAFDGRVWTGTAAPDALVAKSAADAVDVEVWLHPSTPPGLFVVGRLIGKVEWVTSATNSRHYRFRAAPPFGPGPVGNADAPPGEEARRLPSDLNPRLVELARRLEDSPHADPIERTRSWLAREMAYSRVVPSSSDPLAEFVFERREGHCEVFASALAILLRLQGVPSRLATGFAGGEAGGDGELLFRASHAHAWVEAYRPGSGWVVVDATPSFAAPLQTAVWWVSVPAVVLLALALVYQGRKRVMGVVDDSPEVVRCQGRVRGALAEAGFAAPMWMPPVTAARWLNARGAPGGPLFEELAWLGYRVRYGSESETELLPRARELERELRRVLSSRRFG